MDDFSENDIKEDFQSADIRGVILIVIYIILALPILIPVGFANTPLGFIHTNYAELKHYTSFHPYSYFEVYIELFMLSLASFFILMAIYGKSAVKTRALMSCIILLCVYIPFSFLLYVLPYSVDLLSELSQNIIRGSLCARHYTDIVSQSARYLYNCPLEHYTFLFVLAWYFFVILSVGTLSLILSLAYLVIYSIFQEEAGEFNVRNYARFFPRVFLMSFPALVVISLGQFGELYGNPIYQIFTIIFVFCTFIPALWLLFEETDARQAVPITLNKKYFATSVVFLLLSSVLVGLLVNSYWNNALPTSFYIEDIQFHLVFLFFCLFFLLLLALYTKILPQASEGALNVMAIILLSVFLGSVLVLIMVDVNAPKNIIWHLNEVLISRQVFML